MWAGRGNWDRGVQSGARPDPAAEAAGQGGQAEVDEMAAINKKMAPVGATLDLLAVVLIALMVWKPGA